jgi:chitin disaccharide deacetylase
MKRIIHFFLFPVGLLLVFNVSTAQDSATYAEKLGWGRGDRVVILHVDDAGMSFESNEGTIEALTKGVATSCSVMMPCPWVPGFVQLLKQHPSIDAGLHLTLTSEWKQYRWGPLSGKSQTPGLVDKEGALWPSVEGVVRNANAVEVEKEIKAQLERAREMGFEPTHFDSHMGTLFATPPFMEKYVQLGIENKIPVMMPAGHAALIKQQTGLTDQQIRQLRMVGKKLWNAGLPVLDDLHNYSYEWQLPDGESKSDKNLQKFKTEKYKQALASLKPGVTMVIMHCTSSSPVFPHISDSGPTRKGDLLAMIDPELKKFIEKEGIILTTWKELKLRRDKAK